MAAVGKRIAAKPGCHLAAGQGRDARRGGRLRAARRIFTPRTILVVHESAAVVELIEMTLRRHGDAVLGTTNGLEALDVMRRVAIDLLLLDGADQSASRALVSDLRAIQPGLRVLLLRAEPTSLIELADAVARELDR